MRRIYLLLPNVHSAQMTVNELLLLESASRGPFRFFWTTECEAGHAIRFGDFSLPGNDVAQALHGNDGEENRDGTDSSRAAGRLPRETRDGRQRWQWGATAEHVGDH
jgi:hypothetical protein